MHGGFRAAVRFWLGFGWKCPDSSRIYGDRIRVAKGGWNCERCTNNKTAKRIFVRTAAELPCLRRASRGLARIRRGLATWGIEA